MIVIAGSGVDEDLQSVSSAYKSWRESNFPQESAQPVLWKAAASDMDVYPLFPHIICLVVDGGEPSVAFAFRYLYVTKRLDVALYLPASDERAVPYDAGQYVTAVARFVRESSPPTVQGPRQSGRAHGLKEKISRFLHLNPTVPEAYTGAPFTTLSRQNPRVYLCATGSAEAWLDAMGYTETPFRDNIAQHILKLIDICNDVLLAAAT
eukprot:2653281-Rhodomonas_salina.8